VVDFEGNIRYVPYLEYVELTEIGGSDGIYTHIGNLIKHVRLVGWPTRNGDPGRILTSISHRAGRYTYSYSLESKALATTGRPAKYQTRIFGPIMLYYRVINW
jgi:hypothetical protein